MNADHADEDHGELGHIVPFKVYLNVCIALLVLTVITVLASSKAGFLDFGDYSLLVAFLIATVKATLVAMFFMHLKYEDPLTWLYVAFPLLLLAILMGGVFIDNPIRTDAVSGTFVEKLLEEEAAAAAAREDADTHH